jgi:hypothetical protein
VRRRLGSGVVDAAIPVWSFLLTASTALVSRPLDVERRGTIVESASVEFGLPIPFARAESGEPWVDADHPEFLATFNPLENVIEFERDRFLLSWLLLGLGLFVLVLLTRWWMHVRAARRA